MIIRHEKREFILNARYDGDFWLVDVFEVMAGKRRLRFEYKLNEPKNEAAARERAWALFSARQLEG